MPSSPDTGLLLGKVDYRESDWVVTLFTQQRGRVAALARGARRSQKRFGGVLEPMHTLTLTLEDRPTRDLMVLREASIDVARIRLVARLDTLEAAGRALAWVRASTPQHQREPGVYASVIELLDQLNQTSQDRDSRLFLAEFGFRLLNALGFGIDFHGCVRCGRACAEGRAAYVDAKKGGLVCRACGGASRRLEGPQRERFARAGSGASGVLELPDADAALPLVEQALKAHLGVEPS
ncbi:MAG TPA: DNA repair protein RecO [Polyangiaceae bacterium]|nr:DNA repair protein RecO [Polyangiaceae bacterium]